MSHLVRSCLSVISVGVLCAAIYLMSEKEQALAGLTVLSETCKSALATLTTLSRSVSNTQSPPIQILRNDTLSFHRLIHTSTTRLSVSLGKPPPSYPIALVPLKDLTSYVAQLTSCTSSFPPGALRKEAVWATEEVVQALDALVQYFENRCRRDGKVGKEYLAKTGAVHDATAKAEGISRDEAEAVVKAWTVNGENLEDSLKEVKEMMKDDAEEQGGFEEDGWDELGEGFGSKLKPEEIERVKKIYPLLRFTTLLHARILSHHILKPPPARPYSRSHLTNLLTLSDSLLPATDDLASALYAPQHAEGIQESALAVHRITKDLQQELANVEAEYNKSAEEMAREALDRLCLEDGVGGTKPEGSRVKIRKWFQQCFAQIDIIHEGLHFDT